MDLLRNYSTALVSALLFSNFLTLLVSFGWVRFFDAREGIISAPSLHHRSYLRALIVLSAVSFLSGLTAVTLFLGGCVQLLR